MEARLNVSGVEVLITSISRDGGEVGSVVMSRDGVYRYGLSRCWDVHDVAAVEARPVVVMLNPSTADHAEDDGTIRRVRGLLARDGHAGVFVVNLFAYRTRSPVKLLAAPDPEGPANLEFVRSVVTERNDVPVIAAWGAHGSKPRVGLVVDKLTAMLDGTDWQCWGTTKDGDPCHPLYLPASTRLRPWRQP